MPKAIWTTAMLAASLLLASCASATPGATPSPEPGSIAGVTWLLEDLGGQAPVEGSPVTVHFSDDGALFGSGGCNRFSGTYELDGATLAVGDALPSTMMACADDVMALESAFFTALTSARGFAVEDETLTLNDESGAPLGTLAAQSQDLAGTTWNITAYNDGVSAVVSVLESAEANLTFADDGTISGTAGCNRVLGSYTAGDGTISFGTLATTQMLCGADGVMDQEAAVIVALESAATYIIEGDTLDMRTAEDAIAVQFTRA